MAENNYAIRATNPEIAAAVAAAIPAGSSVEVQAYEKRDGGKVIVYVSIVGAKLVGIDAAGNATIVGGLRTDKVTRGKDAGKKVTTSVGAKVESTFSADQVKALVVS